MGWFEIPGMGGLVWNGNWDLADGNQANFKPHGRGIVVIPGTGISAIWVNYGMPIGVSATANIEDEKCITPMVNHQKNGTQKTFNIDGREYDIEYKDDQQTN